MRATRRLRLRVGSRRRRLRRAPARAGQRSKARARCPRASRLVGAAEAVERALEEALRETGPGIGDVQLDDVVPLTAKRSTRPPPWSSAFSTRFASACSTRAGSAETSALVGRSSSSWPRSCARRAKRSATVVKSSSTSMRSARIGSAPWSARAIRADPPRAATAGSSPRQQSGLRASSSSCERGRRSASSSSVRNMASGVRSSWLAFATNRRSCSNAASSRPSISFSVVARREISSRPGGTGQPAGLLRRHRRRAAAHRLDRPERGGGEAVARERGEKEREGRCEEQLLEQVVQRLLARLERTRDDHHAAVGGQREIPPVTIGPDKRDRAALQLPVRRSARGRAPV